MNPLSHRHDSSRPDSFALLIADSIRPRFYLWLFACVFLLTGAADFLNGQESQSGNEATHSGILRRTLTPLIRAHDGEVAVDVRLLDSNDVVLAEFQHAWSSGRSFPDRIAMDPMPMPRWFSITTMSD